MVMPCSGGMREKTYRQTREERVVDIPNSHTCVLSFIPVLSGIDVDIDDGSVSAKWFVPSYPKNLHLGEKFRSFIRILISGM